MEASPFFGVLLHAVGGLAAASFYIPYRGVKKWAWESYWLVGGVFSWIVVPLVVARLAAPGFVGILADAPRGSLFWSFVFGMLWGVGGLTFGLTMRFLGMSLGYALALGFCAAFGTIIPPLFSGEFSELMNIPGAVVLGGVAVCLGGIAVCGNAGMRKERELPDEAKKETIQEFNFAKGVWVAVFCGIMSACMAFGIKAGAPIAALAGERGVPALWCNTPVFLVILPGGFATNLVWCLFLNLRNKTGGDYVDRKSPLLWNYLFSALAGTIWYFQFMFYGMGTTQMGRFHFSSWTLHMAFIIIFGNLWGLALREWRGSSRRTLVWVTAGVAILVLSTAIVGWGNKLGADAEQQSVSERAGQARFER